MLLLQQRGVHEGVMGVSIRRRFLLSWLALAVLMLLLFRSSCGNSRFPRPRSKDASELPTGSGSGLGRAREDGVRRARGGEEGDIFVDDKRRVRTGPNPLHNR
ncbi:hypothetical protein MLD38_009508 [Melastoma candidum]|uniref:Uncharacterized protein n=1 Tax=Melastoma candidum TaxID=119954 RepID=A0ACB9RZ26_9MYRT|nr:hypothetical protein MLD38_009508 [Melastoma candidum]